jgi:AraC-like DNA-binding protein/mannose-6-phosphate isomerase-like protein (cupin superfamily)
MGRSIGNSRRACFEKQAEHHQNRAMARHVRAAQMEDVDRPVVAVGNDYPAGHLHAAHAHRRSQLLFAELGTMLVETQHGSWMVPPHQAMWIPEAVRHSITMLSAVATRSVYLDRRAARGMARQCEVVGVSPLLRQLLIAAVDLPPHYEPRSRAGRILSLLVDEIRLAPALPLSLPFPAEARLAARCRRFVERPTAQDTIDRWSRALGLSRRSFTRLFRQETGLTFSAWQRRACLLAAVPRLLAGEAVTTVAFDLDYSSPAAFTTMFRKLVGTSPSAYRRATR